MDKNSKAITCFLFLLISFGINAQTNYTFDYKFLIKSSLSSVNKSELIINSENPDYVMYKYNDEISKLFDYENNEVIKLNHKTEPSKSIYKFISSQKLSLQNGLIVDDIIVEKISENKYLIECLLTNNSIKTKIKLTVKLKPWDKDLIRFYFTDLDDDTDKRLIASLKAKLNGNYNFIIESYTMDYKGIKISNSIKNIEKVLLKIAFQN
ncbi:hypothetical protein HNP24_003382 [Chryseobacterium sediminis]|uniref:Uncharacterized protein n=1 Tax=Chryseobacterium sediminis TaxID=1679494 RepID=A0ABR6Q355_9FLAO|nr:hypothetical protein [Chryseobacterium sediminis]MBB6332390.1 hypothetical protein [Chryseobacterium sediminis]